MSMHAQVQHLWSFRWSTALDASCGSGFSFYQKQPVICFGSALRQGPTRLRHCFHMRTFKWCQVVALTSLLFVVRGFVDSPFPHWRHFLNWGVVGVGGESYLSMKYAFVRQSVILNSLDWLTKTARQIKTDWLLSHPAETNASPKPNSLEITVKAGLHDLSSYQENTTQVIKAKQVLQHPMFSPMTSVSLESVSWSPCISLFLQQVSQLRANNQMVQSLRPC